MSRMSRIGTVEKLNVAAVLQRMETFTKTGLLVVKQDTQWIEFYCHEGRLLCVGPIRTDATLGERLLQDGMISFQALQETMLAIGGAVPSETRIALTLIDLGYIKREELRAWIAKKTQDILAAALSWSTGELLFDENADAPSERLLVSLSISEVLTALSVVNITPQVMPVEQHVVQGGTTGGEEPFTNLAAWEVSQTAIFHNQTQFFAEPSSTSTPHATPYISASALLPVFSNAVNTGPVMPPSQTPPSMPSVPMTTLPPTREIDTSFMQPDMVLVPADLSALPAQHVQVTPDQWRLLTRVDGLTSLQDACVTLKMRVEDVRRVAGELIAERIVRVVSPYVNEIQEMSSVPQNLLLSGLSNGLAIPSYAATLQPAWDNVLYAPDIMHQIPSTLETHSQWGNGGNGATFVPGQGWIAPMQPLQPLQSNSGSYVSVGGSH
ncbi:MAG: hypothetical protein NVS4B1_01010 [Ktedonobacteraceae bacterium]